MTNKQKKDYLSRYIEILSELQMLEELRGKLLSISAPVLSDMPHSPNRKLDGLQEKINDYIDKETDFIMPKIQELTKLKMDTYNAIYTLSDSTLRQVMLYRYIYGLGWAEICVKLHYEWAWTHRLHGKALSLIKIMDS